MRWREAAPHYLLAPIGQFDLMRVPFDIDRWLKPPCFLFFYLSAASVNGVRASRPTYPNQSGSRNKKWLFHSYCICSNLASPIRHLQLTGVQRMRTRLSHANPWKPKVSGKVIDCVLKELSLVFFLSLLIFWQKNKHRMLKSITRRRSSSP